MDRVIHAVAPDAATIVFVEHDMEIVSRYADRVVAFYQGRILADGDPRDVLKDPEVRRYVTGGARDDTALATDAIAAQRHSISAPAVIRSIGEEEIPSAACRERA